MPGSRETAAGKGNGIGPGLGPSIAQERKNLPRTYDVSSSCIAVECQIGGKFRSLLGRGGTKKTSKCFGVGINTVRSGLAEFNGEEQLPDKSRIRRAGAGRKATEVAQPGLREAVQKAREGSSYGDPERVLFWSTLSLRDIQEIVAAQGFKASHVTIGRLIGELGYSKQLNQKLLQVGEPHPNRDDQFRFIEATVQSYLAAGLPVISVDCKKKELLGNFKNNGQEYRKSQDPRPVLDHDFMLKELEIGRASCRERV